MGTPRIAAVRANCPPIFGLYHSHLCRFSRRLDEEPQTDHSGSAVHHIRGRQFAHRNLTQAHGDVKPAGEQAGLLFGRNLDDCKMSVRCLEALVPGDLLEPGNGAFARPQLLVRPWPGPHGS